MGGGARLLGRDAEQRQVGTLLTAARNGRGGSLLLLGEPGIGKSTLLGRDGRRQRACTTCAVTGYEAESTIPFAALYRLMLPLREHFAALSDTHQQALRVAAGSAQGPPPDRFLIGMGVLALVAAAERGDAARLRGRRRPPPRRRVAGDARLRRPTARGRVRRPRASPAATSRA